MATIECVKGWILSGLMLFCLGFSWVILAIVGVVSDWLSGFNKHDNSQGLKETQAFLQHCIKSLFQCLEGDEINTISGCSEAVTTSAMLLPSEISAGLWSPVSDVTNNSETKPPEETNGQFPADNSSTEWDIDTHWQNDESSSSLERIGAMNLKEDRKKEETENIANTSCRKPHKILKKLFAGATWDSFKNKVFKSQDQNKLSMRKSRVWNSPARLPKTKHERRKSKGWVPFICCSRLN